MCSLTVTAPAGVTVTVGKEEDVRTKTADGAGQAVFEGLESGLWTVTITDGDREKSMQMNLSAEYTAQLAFASLPEFSYTGTYAVDESGGDWKIRLLTSGTLRFSNLNGAEKGIDVFLVGGGGGGPAGASNYGGAGGGYTSTARKHIVAASTDYEITVGDGGVGKDGGLTSAFGYNASGGHAPAGCAGGAGGSGGGAGWYGSAAGSVGGSDGQDAPNGAEYSGGRGQGFTTREFGEADGTLYAGGGGGGSGDSAAVLSGGAGGGGNTGCGGAANTGGGAGAARKNSATTGGSGIVVIRGAR